MYSSSSAEQQRRIPAITLTGTPHEMNTVVYMLRLLGKWLNRPYDVRSTSHFTGIYAIDTLMLRTEIVANMAFRTYMKRHVNKSTINTLESMVSRSTFPLMHAPPGPTRHSSYGLVAQADFLKLLGREQFMSDDIPAYAQPSRPSEYTAIAMPAEKNAFALVAACMAITLDRNQFSVKMPYSNISNTSLPPYRLSDLSDRKLNIPKLAEVCLQSVDTPGYSDDLLSSRRVRTFMGQVGIPAHGSYRPYGGWSVAERLPPVYRSDVVEKITDPIPENEIIKPTGIVDIIAEQIDVPVPTGIVEITDDGESTIPPDYPKPPKNYKGSIDAV